MESRALKSDYKSVAGSGKPSRTKKSTGGDTTILNWYLNEIHKIPMLEREEEMEVAVKAHSGDTEARNILVRSNLRFVVTVARKYQSYGLSMMDLINEGNMGLIKAAERFNPERGYHFISYAVWWIKQSILFAIQQKSQLIRLPLNRAAELRRYDEIERNNYGEPEMKLKDKADHLGMEPEELNHLLNMSRDHLSLDAPIGDTEDFSLADTVEDVTASMPEERVEKSDLKHEIEACLDQLTDRERKVLTLRFGLGGKAELSLQKIGNQIGLSKERIRQVEKTAIRKIRTGLGSRQLVSYLS